MVKKHPEKIRRVDDLLATKLKIPALGCRIVCRNQLTALLSESLGHRLTLLVAPTGYGKTTLLVEWLSTVSKMDWWTAWVSLDTLDNEPLKFWTYLGSAFQKIYPQFRDNPSYTLEGGDSYQDFSQLTPLLNGIASIPHQVCLILDNYEEITDEHIQNGISFLIQHQPENLHLIISSRVMPPIPLARLRAQRQLTELTSRDLSFSQNETAAFLSNVMALNLDTDQVAALQNATEGWIAGLQLAALSLQGQPTPYRLWNDLPVNRRQITEYLSEEVFNRQDPEIKNFLVQTSILTELSAPLCDALLDRSDSQTVLTRIENANLFIVSLDHHQGWYRYHPLFADALKNHLKQTNPESIPELHQKACNWLLEHDYPDKAVLHALQMGNLEKAAEIVDSCAIEAIYEFDLTSLVYWISYFSNDLILNRPRLGVYYALSNFLLGRLDLVEPKLHIVEQSIENAEKQHASVTDLQLIHWEMSAIRTALNCVQGNISQGISQASELSRHVPDKDAYFLGFLYHWIAEAYNTIGNLEASAQNYQQAIQFANEHHLLIGLIHSGCGLAIIRKKQGRLREAQKEYRQALESAIQSHLDLGAIALAQTGLLEIALEKNKIDVKDSMFQEVVNHFDEINKGTMNWNDRFLISLRLSKYYLALQDVAHARFYLNKANENLRKYRNTILTLPDELIEVYIRNWAILSPLEIEDEWLKNELLEKPAEKRTLIEQIAIAKVYLSKGENQNALALLIPLKEMAQKSDTGEYLLEILILQALAQKALQKTEEALATLQEALKLADLEGYLRIFIDEGAAMQALINDCYSRCQTETGDQPQKEILQKLIVAFGPEKEASSPDELFPTTVIPLLEPLSDREIDVIRLLVEKKSIKEVSSALVISPNTTKVHIKNIYRKLDIHTRKELAERAIDLGIISKA